MPNDAPRAAVAAQADRLRSLHRAPGLTVLPNAWDAATAQAFAAAGFPAIATTSGGVASALGHEDHERAPVDDMVAAAARIIRAVDVPVTIDFEAGYGLSPEAIVDRVIAAGGAGLNLEDSDHGSGGLVDADAQADRLAAVKAATTSAGVDLVVNARVDVFVRGEGGPDVRLAEALRRARLYRRAGADCIYPIGLGDETMIATLVEAVGVLNVNLRRGGPLSLDRAAALGVRRVTFGSSLFRDAMAGVRQIADELHATAGAAGAG